MKILIPLYIAILVTLATTSWLARADGHGVTVPLVPPTYTQPTHDIWGRRAWLAPPERRQVPQSSFGSYDSQGRWRNGQYRNWGPQEGCYVESGGLMRCP